MVQALLTADQLAAALRDLPQWLEERGEIVREYEHASVLGAVDLIAQIANLAEEMNHHPDLRWVYKRLSIRLSTHDAGGLTALDVELAQKIESLLEAA